MDGSVGLLWEEWAKAGETMERKRYGGIGDGGEMFWRLIRRNEPRWKRWEELKAESDYVVKAWNGRRAVWCRPCERDDAWVFMSSYGSIWIYLSHLSSKDRPSVRSSRLVMASSNKQTNKQKNKWTVYASKQKKGLLIICAVVRVNLSRASQRHPRSALTLHKSSITPSFRRANSLPFSRHHAHIRGNEGNHSSQMSKQAISITATSNLSHTIQSGNFFKLENRKIVLTFQCTEPHVHTCVKKRDLSCF